MPGPLRPPPPLSAASPTSPIKGVRSCVVMEPGRRIAARAPLRSNTVDSRPTAQGPPSRISGTRAPSEAATWPAVVRSEEHTSELQSLMRISYAVFCLKKKTTLYRKHSHTSYATEATKIHKYTPPTYATLTSHSHS